MAILTGTIRQTQGIASQGGCTSCDGETNKKETDTQWCMMVNVCVDVYACRQIDIDIHIDIHVDIHIDIHI